MRLVNDTDRWYAPANRQPPRLQTTAKEEEIKRQIQSMLKIGIIQRSTEGHYSQVHLVPKPDNKWRFTIDYRNLNSCSTIARWPLPHIGNMLQRIGSRKPSYFAKFDMTSGYHQFPLHPDDSKYTSFITYMGIYEWNRIVMGLSGAGSNFQERMATEVLASLIYVTCEVYLDDILVYGTTEHELLTRVREILERFRAFHVFFNPKKVEIGLERLEFVGHLIDKYGIHMTDSKLDSIRNFPQPVLKRELKSFLGLANYFRDHVRHHSSLAKPLQDAIQGYSAKDRNHRIKWTDDLSSAFVTMKDAVSKSQKLNFLRDDLEIFLQTDASDYGIGAYLFQKVPTPTTNTEHPIMFISKSLDKVQCKWSTPEKEMYAIWYALKKMEHLIRDTHFILETDHENLTREKTTGSPKVLRWKLDIQQYDYTIRHIKGVDNVVADGFSRLCDKEDIEYCASLNEEESVAQYLFDEEQTATQQRHTCLE